MKPFTSHSAALTYFDDVMRGPVSWLERPDEPMPPKKLWYFQRVIKVTMGCGKTDLAERWEK